MYKRRTIIDSTLHEDLFEVDPYGIVRRFGIGEADPINPAIASAMLADHSITAHDFVTTAVAYAMEFGLTIDDLVDTANVRGLPLPHIALMQCHCGDQFAQEMVERSMAHVTARGPVIIPPPASVDAMEQAA